MRKHLMLVSTASLFLLPAACKRGGSRVAPTPTPTAAMEVEGSSVEMEGSSGGKAEEAHAAPEASPTPLALDEAGIKRFIAHRREMIAFVGPEQKKIIQLGDQKGNDMARIKAMADINTELEKGIESIRKKNGYTEAQEREISDAVTEVLADALTKNSAMAPVIADMRKTEAAGGPAGAAAKAQLKQFEDQEKASLATARSRYGNAAVDVILAHYAELDALQKEAITAAFGAPK